MTFIIYLPNPSQQNCSIHNHNKLPPDNQKHKTPLFKIGEFSTKSDAKLN